MRTGADISNRKISFKFLIQKGKMFFYTAIKDILLVVVAVEKIFVEKSSESLKTGNFFCSEKSL